MKKFQPKKRHKLNLQNEPNPESWKKPSAYFTLGANCPAEIFQEQSIVISQTFCGGWGQVDVPNCSENVFNKPSFFNEAFWLINYLKVFQTY